MHVLLVLCIFLCILILDSLYESSKLEVTQYCINSEKIPQTFHGTKFMVLADLHNNRYGKDNIKLWNAIHAKNPDYILIAGDMIVGAKNSKNNNITLSFLSKLAKQYPVFYGYGNHEQKVMPGGDNYDGSFDEYKKSLESLGVHFLENKQIRITQEGNSIVITGLMIEKEYYKKIKRPKMITENIQNLVGIADNQCYNILIAHNPVYFLNYSDWGADLTVSGHIHGGIIRLPGLGGMVSPQYKFFPKYDAGIFRNNGKTMLVSRGIGLHTIKIRVLNRPEIMMVTLVRNE